MSRVAIAQFVIWQDQRRPLASLRADKRIAPMVRADEQTGLEANAADIVRQHATAIALISAKIKMS